VEEPATEGVPDGKGEKIDPGMFKLKEEGETQITSMIKKNQELALRKQKTGSVVRALRAHGKNCEGCTWEVRCHLSKREIWEGLLTPQNRRRKKKSRTSLVLSLRSHHKEENS